MKRKIRELFTQVKEGHRVQVLKALEQGCRTNEERLSYLKGWLKLD